MAVVTSNGKRRQHWPSANYHFPSPNSKRPRLPTMSQNHAQSVLSSSSIISRISMYPETKPPLHREVHAPCRPRKFDSPAFNRSAHYSRKEEISHDVGNLLSKNYQRAKNSALASIRFGEKGKEVIEVDADSSKGMVSEEDSSVEEVRFVEEDGREVRSVVTEHKWQEGDLVVTEVKDLDAKDMCGGPQQQSTSSVVSELTNGDLNVVNAEKMLDILSLTPDHDLSSVQAYKKLLDALGQRTDTLNRLEAEIKVNEKRMSTFELLRPKKELVEEVPLEPFIPLTKEEEVEVAHAFSTNRKKILVSHEKSGIEISGEKFQCLRPGAWLNDEVINVYLELLKERERREPQKFLNCHFFSTFFYKRLISGKNGYDFKSVRRWTSQKKLGYGLHECDKIFVPIHKEIHWCLAVINKKDKKFQYLDSLRGTDAQVMKVLASYIVDEVKDKTGKDIDVSSWKKEFVEDLPEQQNGYDCGVFMIKYADFYSRNLGLCFNQIVDWTDYTYHPDIQRGFLQVWGRINSNCDGAVSGGVAACGRVLRNQAGAVVVFAHNLGMCSISQAEIWAITMGVKLAWDKGFTNLYVKSDFKYAIEMMDVGEIGKRFSVRRHILGATFSVRQTRQQMLLLNLALMLDGQSKVFYSTPSFLSAHVLADVAALLGESMIDDGSYKDGATDPTLLCFAFALWEVNISSSTPIFFPSLTHQSKRKLQATLYHRPATDAGDAVMARWLQSAGLQHLASPLASTAIDQRLLPNLLMQGYGAQSAEEKQRLFKLMRNLNFNGESGSEPYTPTSQNLGGVAVSDGFYSPDFRGDFGAGLLDLHAMDDTELLSEHVISEPFEPSPFMPGGSRGFEDDFNPINRKQERGEADSDVSLFLPTNEKDNTRENNVAKIKVVVRKRPLNKKELAKKEDDIVTVYDNAYLMVHEPKLKVDLTAYVEKHEFCFDAVLDENVTNDEVYRVTVEPIIPTIFEKTKATCFAYGQTGSGKTYTMQPLPLRAAEDLVRQLHRPVYRNQRFKLWLSYFEIYGGKLFDLLSDRKKLCMREDGRQQVCIVGLQEFEVSDVQIVKEFIEKGNAARSTGSTGANEESSRSHAILQLVVKRHNEVKESRRKNNDVNEAKSGKVVGKISFIDLAGSERGADTTDNDRQTRIEGAEINKSLLALKECIRALDNDQIHIPFRGSKLTEVLRDSFVGNSKTVMISCISPNAGSCEHTLNTLRYADRVKSLSKSGNPRKDQATNPVPPAIKEVSSTSSLPASVGADDFNGQCQEVKTMDMGRKVVEKESSLYSSAADVDKQSSFSSSYPFNGREEKSSTSAPIDRERFEVKNSYGGDSTSQKMNSYSIDVTNEKVQRVSPPRRKGTKEEKSERSVNWVKRDANGSDHSTASSKQQSTGNYSITTGSGQSETESSSDVNISAILEEEEALIAAHRKEIEDTMEIVREEMKLLAEVDQPGSLIDNYVTQLSFVLSRKAASLVSLQARLARFQHRLKEQEILSRKRVPR
ncbi:Kinesin-like protein KIN-13A [Glycine soja]